MSGIDIVKSALAAAEAGDFAKVSGMVTDDMQFAGPVPNPVGKKEFIGIQSAMVAGIPDWKFNAADFKEEGDQVKATLQITGTQSKELRPPIPGVQPIPASGKHLPCHPVRYPGNLNQPVIRHPVVIAPLANPGQIDIGQKVHIQIEAVGISCHGVEMIPAVEIDSPVRSVVIDERSGPTHGDAVQRRVVHVDAVDLQMGEHPVHGFCHWREEY